MSAIALEVVFIFVLLLANGLFAMAEIAVVSARKTRLKALAEEGDERAKLALELAVAPGRFLSTVQVGITLVGVLAGAVGGAHISDTLGDWLEQFSLTKGWGDYLAIFLVVSVITYLSVIIGELVPKRLALNSPESIASALARPMNGLSTFASPVVSFLNASSDLLMAVLGVKKEKDNQVSEEEVRVLIDEGLSAGVFKKAEKEMVEGVFELDEQAAEDLMTPRARIIWLCADVTDEENWRRIAGSGHSHFPLYENNRDNILGMVSVKSLWANLSLAGNADLRALATPPLYVPSSMPAGKLIEEFKRTGQHIALAVDEFGGVQGLITLNDLMEAIVGHLPQKEQRHEPKAIKRADGSWLVDALLDIDQMKTALSITEELPEEEEGEYTTLAGFLLNRLGHIPKEGEKVKWSDWSFEIVDMDRQRIDKVLATHSPKAESVGTAEEKASLPKEAA